MSSVTLTLAAVLVCISAYFIVAAHFLKMPVLRALGVFWCVLSVYAVFEHDVLLAVCMTGLYYLRRSFRTADFERRITELVVLCSVYAGAVINLFFPSPRIADIIALVFLLVVCSDAVKARCEGFVRVVLVSLVPVIGVFGAVLVLNSAGRRFVPVDTLLLPSALAGAAVCVFGLPLYLGRTFQQREKKMITFFSGDESLTAEKIISANSVSGSAVRSLLERILAPVEQIQQTAAQMQDGETDIAADSRFILGKVNEIKSCAGKELSAMLSVPEAQSSVAVRTQKKIVRPADEPGRFTGKVCVFEDRPSSVSVSEMLSAAGADCVRVREESELFRMLDKKEISLLVVEPSVTDSRSFDVCRRIRSAENMLSFPILMIVSYFENGIIRRAYDTGVNDFIIRPFDVSELVLRVSFLLQLNALYREKEAIALSEKEKRAFLYFVTHNVNTPLALLENRIDELVGDCASGAPVEKLVLDDIQESVGEIHNTIQNVLISFRISDGRYINSVQNVDVSEMFGLLRESAETKAGLKGQRIDLICADTLPPVRCNDNALRGILTNLIDNAVKFAPVGTGAIHVRARLNSEDTVTISVADNGPGIPPEKRSVLFNRFSDRGTVSTGGEQSNGLGLYVVHELAQMNDIAISYSDAPGGGSCFTLAFLKK